MRLTLTIASALALFAVACSPYDPDLGDTPFRCGTEEPLCPDGYVCVDSSESPTGICQEEGSAPRPDAGDDPSGADAGPFACNDDSSIEPNDQTSSAHVTPIPDSQLQYALATLAICPGGDVDVYRLRVDVAAMNIVAKVTTNRSQGDLVLEILNASGVPVATGSYTSGTVLDAALNNAATGVWYVQVRGADASVQNNYRLDLELTGP